MREIIRRFRTFRNCGLKHGHGTRTRTNTNPNGTEANAAGRSGNARALRASQNRKGRGALAKFLEKFAKSEEFVGAAHSAEQ